MNNKMKKLANTLDIFAKVAGNICRVMAIVMLVFLILTAVFGEKMFADGSLSVDLDFVKLYLTDEYQAVTGPLIAFACVGLATVGGMCYVIYHVCRILRQILAPMKEGRPFDANVPADLRKIAWLTLGSGAVIQAVSVIERMLTTRMYPMDKVFAAEAVAKVEYTYTWDMGFVLVFAVIMFLSYIFDYGQKLQRESDETL